MEKLIIHSHPYQFGNKDIFLAFKNKLYSPPGVRQKLASLIFDSLFIKKVNRKAPRVEPQCSQRISVFLSFLFVSVVNFITSSSLFVFHFFYHFFNKKSLMKTCSIPLKFPTAVVSMLMTYLGQLSLIDSRLPNSLACVFSSPIK